ncbi:MAG TPA: immunity protein Tsi6 family protein [Caulobacteraceae bacterium]|jgi:hypothetical protein
MERLSRLEAALEQSLDHVDLWGEHAAIRSIIIQLEYLIGLETGRTQDRSPIRDISIGVLAAREIEGRDVALAQLLHAVADDVKRADRQRGSV